MARLPKVRCRVIPVFPAAVDGGSGIAVSKANGRYSIDLDVSDFEVSSVPTAQENTTYAISWGQVTDVNPAGSFRLVPYTGIQAASTDLTSLAELGTTGLVARTADATYATRTLTAGTGLSVTNGGGVAGNPTVAVSDAELLAFAGVTSAANKLFYFTGSGTGALADFSAFGRTLVDDADASAARTTLGLSSVATATPAALTKTDDTNVTLTLGGTPATALLQATSITLGWTGALAVSRGGTGVGTLTAHAPILSQGTGAFTSVPSYSVGTNGLPLISNAPSSDASFSQMSPNALSGLATGVVALLGTPTSANLAAVLTDETGSGLAVFNNGATLVAPILGTPASGTLTNTTGLPVATGISGLGTGVATALAVNVGSAGAPVVNGGALGTPLTGTLTNATGLPITTGVSGLGTGVATFLATPNSANLRGALTDETGTGPAVFATSPALTTPTGIVKGDVGLGNVDNTSNATERAASATLTNKTIAATANTLQIPYFSASLSANQSTTNSVSNKLLCNTELADSNSWYDNATNYRFTPQLAGKYEIKGQVSVIGTNLTELDISIYKNGALYSQSFNVSAAVSALSLALSHIVSFNGSTDYVEIFAAAYGTAPINFLGGTGPIRTWFEAKFLGA